MVTSRHSWPDEMTVREAYRTVRTCSRCGLQRITHHEAEVWVDFWRDGRQVSKNKTPACVTAPGAPARSAEQRAQAQVTSRDSAAASPSVPPTITD